MFEAFFLCQQINLRGFDQSERKNISLSVSKPHVHSRVIKWSVS